MYSNKDNITITVAMLKENNIKNLVISPGGTNIPLINAVQNDDFFICYSVVDERSAAYVAIGIYLQKRVPVALICTSAQATRNYIPGLTEAYYKRVPILAITMEKHPRFKYQEYMQAPDQTSLPKDSVKRSFELPYVSDINDYYHSMRVANEAVLELSNNGPGPVQLCIPWLDFPLSDVKPAMKFIKRYSVCDIREENLENSKILLVIGEHVPFTAEETEAITNFCKQTNAAVYINHLSNFSNEYSIEANLFLLTASMEELTFVKPDIIITIGGQTGDYPLYLAFSKNTLNNVEHWRICEDGNVVDTYDKLTRIYQGKESDFFQAVNTQCSEHDYVEKWKESIALKEAMVEVPFSNIAIAQYLHDRIPDNSIVQFSILNSLRVWNWYHLDPSIQCYSNVGAFGIDGGMSTLIGQSLATEKLAFMVIGDLAFLYDMNCLSIRGLKNNVRILLINNNGGIEFKLNGEDRQQRDRFIAAANYSGKAKDWAESCGFKYYAAKNMNDFEKYSKIFISESDCPIILEAFVSDLDESDAYTKILRENKEMTTKESVKNVVKGILGKDNFSKLKHTLKGE